MKTDVLYQLLLLVFSAFLYYPTQAQKKVLRLEKLSSAVNSEIYDEISPVISIDGKTMYFTRVAYPNFDRNLILDGKDLAKTLNAAEYDIFLQNVYTRIAGRSITQPTMSTYNQDVWIAKSTVGDDFDQIIHPGPPLNNALPNSICAITEDPNIFVIINQFIPGGGMAEGFSTIRKYSDESWTSPVNLQINDYYTDGDGVNLTVSSDGAVMILSLQRADSQGQNDLYFSQKKADGTWSAPKNLGLDINTIKREVTPSLSEDKKTLYFSSNRWNTAGGNDIFMSKRLDDTWQRWSPPRRFKVPINSNRDDSQPYFNEATGYLYFTSRRDGSSDIFRVQIANPQPQEVTIKGRIIDAETEQLLPATVYYGSSSKAHYAKQQQSKNGEFQFGIPKGETFKIKGVKKGYISDVETFSFDENLYYHDEQEVDLRLTPVKVGAKIIFKTIYFKQSKADILASSQPTIENLIGILNDYENISIEIGGHTDNQGDSRSLQLLSEQRAVAVKRMLINAGVEAKRISIAGYGGSQPIADNMTAALRKKNRRVEVTITEVEQ